MYIYLLYQKDLNMHAQQSGTYGLSVWYLTFIYIIYIII